MKKFIFMCSLLLCFMVGACGRENKEENVGNPTVIPTASIVPTDVPSPTPAEAPVELTVYSQLSGFWGEQQGWFAKVVLDKFNVKLNIVPDLPDREEKELEKLGDIIIFGGVSDYKEAAEKGWLLDWEANSLLEEHGSYIQEHMGKVLEHNRSLTPEIGKVFGIGHGAAASWKEAETFLYYWEIRWDLYEQLSCPEVKNLEELTAVFEEMKKLSPKDDNGEETYALSIWSEWDEAMIFYVRAMASAYYGYDEFHLGLYDSANGSFYGALQEDGPYLDMIRYFNQLYRKGLLDPDSRTQKYEDMCEKLQSSGVLFSLFDYSGSMAYNMEPQLLENCYMAPLIPEEATPLACGMNIYGGNRVWTIGANTQYPELCMELINWLCTPEGVMVSQYGPQGVIWDYDAEGNTYFTEFGKTCMEERTTQMTGEYAGSCYGDGFPQMNNVTWSLNAVNPDSNGETYNSQSWKSNVPAASCAVEQAWREHTGVLTPLEYVKSKNYVVIPAIYYRAAEKSASLTEVWEKVSDCIVSGSWEAVYAESEEECERLILKMQTEAEELGYEQCMEWCRQEAQKRYELEEAVRR